MRHRPAAVVVASAAVVLSAAWAVNAHFISATGTVLADGALQVSWKEAGLGDNVNIDYLMATHATAT